MSQFVQGYTRKEDGAGRARSQELWSRVPYHAAEVEPDRGVARFDDFIADVTGYNVAQATSGTFALSGSPPAGGGGYARLAAGATTNGQGPTVKDGSSSVVSVPFDGLKLAAEARLVVGNQHATNGVDLFVGFASSAGEPLGSGGAYGDGDFVGVAAIGGVLFGAAKIGSDLETVDLDAELVDDAPIKLGMLAEGKNLVRFFIDGQHRPQQKLAISGVVPTGGLSRCLALHARGASSTADVDWFGAFAC